MVIGQTAVVGDDVTLYQGVTLGGTSLHDAKRHPTLEDGVIVGSGAQILGPFTVGAGARIGANAVVLQNVPPGATMVGIPARLAVPRTALEHEGEFCAYGTPENLPDPLARSFDGLRGQLAQLLDRVDELERRLEERDETEEGERANGERVPFGAPRIITDDARIGHSAHGGGTN